MAADKSRNMEVSGRKWVENEKLKFTSIRLKSSNRFILDVNKGWNMGRKGLYYAVQNTFYLVYLFQSIGKQKSVKFLIVN